VLGYIADKEDPRVLNYLGYSHRKSGRIGVGLGYYQEALRIDPDYVLAREYLGEAYLTLGDVAAARNQLAEIEKRCGKGCREYSQLAEQLAALGKG
jgi:tetratricopeptide (TPR) repeat protein